MSGMPEQDETEVGVKRTELTKRESEVLDWLCTGRYGKEVAEAMGISPNTQRTYLQRIRKKMALAGEERPTIYRAIFLYALGWRGTGEGR